MRYVANLIGGVHDGLTIAIDNPDPVLSLSIPVGVIDIDDPELEPMGVLYYKRESGAHSIVSAAEDENLDEVTINYYFREE